MLPLPNVKIADLLSEDWILSGFEFPSRVMVAVILLSATERMEYALLTESPSTSNKYSLQEVADVPLTALIRAVPTTAAELFTSSTLPKVCTGKVPVIELTL